MSASKTAIFPVGSRVSWHGRIGTVMWRPRPDCVGVRFDDRVQARSYHPDDLIEVDNSALPQEVADRFAHVEVTDED